MHTYCLCLTGTRLPLHICHIVSDWCLYLTVFRLPLHICHIVSGAYLHLTVFRLPLHICHIVSVWCLHLTVFRLPLHICHIVSVLGMSVNPGRPHHASLTSTEMKRYTTLVTIPRVLPDDTPVFPDTTCQWVFMHEPVSMYAVKQRSHGYSSDCV